MGGRPTLWGSTGGALAACQLGGEEGRLRELLVHSAAVVRGQRVGGHGALQ